VHIWVAGSAASRGDGSSEVTAILPQLASRLLAEMLVEKLGNLAERDGGLRHAIAVTSAAASTSLARWDTKVLCAT
jgi:hypothetical protein